MATDSISSGWLLFLAQLPSAPSSARVALWRRLRASGAAGILNGAWVLPRTAAHARFFDQLQETVRTQGGKVFVLAVSRSAPDMDAGTDAMIMERFRGDRSREYDELAERCGAFLAEISKETRAGKFTFAELEENEQDLEKLTRWLAKIQARDFFPTERGPRAQGTIERCRQALEAFSQGVYQAEGVQAADPGSGVTAAGDPGAPDGADPGDTGEAG